MGNSVVAEASSVVVMLNYKTGEKSTIINEVKTRAIFVI